MVLTSMMERRIIQTHWGILRWSQIAHRTWKGVSLKKAIQDLQINYPILAVDVVGVSSLTKHSAEEAAE